MLDRGRPLRHGGVDRVQRGVLDRGPAVQQVVDQLLGSPAPRLTEDVAAAELELVTAAALTWPVNASAVSLKAAVV